MKGLVPGMSQKFRIMRTIKGKRTPHLDLTKMRIIDKNVVRDTPTPKTVNRSDQKAVKTGPFGGFWWIVCVACRHVLDFPLECGGSDQVDLPSGQVVGLVADNEAGNRTIEPNLCTYAGQHIWRSAINNSLFHDKMGKKDLLPNERQNHRHGVECSNRVPYFQQ